MAAPSPILCDLGLRAYAGSRDLPKDTDRAIGIFIRAEENAETEEEKDTVQYYVNAVERLELPNVREQWEKFEGSEKGRILWEQTSLRI